MPIRLDQIPEGPIRLDQIPETPRQPQQLATAGMTYPYIPKEEAGRRERAVKATSRGVASMGAAVQNIRAKLVGFDKPTTQLGPPPSRFGVPITPERVKMADVEAGRLKESSQLLWDVSKDPEIAAVGGDTLDKIIDLTFENIPYVTASTGAYALTGPAGAFVVGAAVEGNNARQTSRDFFRQQNQGKDLTPEQEKHAGRVGYGVGIIAGAIEAVGGKGVEKLAQRAISKLNSKMAAGAATFGAGTIIESLEEAGQEIAAIEGEETYRDVDWNETVKRVTSSMAGGAFLGGAFKTAAVAGRGVFSQPSKEQPVSEAGVPQVVGPTDQPTGIPPGSNVYRGKETGKIYIETPAQMGAKETQVTEEIPSDEGTKLVSKETGEELEFATDLAVSGRADQPTGTIEPGAEIGFTTEKGSTYTVGPNQTTTRNKAYRPEHGNDYGPKESSQRTYYLTYKEMHALDELRLQSVKTRLVEMPDGRIGVQYLDGEDAGKIERRTVVTPKTIPAIGLHPLEIWKGGTKHHFGNKIVEIKQPAPAAIETELLKTPTPEKMQTKADEIHQTISGDKTRVRLRAEPRSEKELLWRGHAIPEALGLDEDSRRDLMQEIIKRRSMKDATPEEREFFVSYLEGLAEQSGVEVDKPVIERAIERLTAISKKQKKLTPTEETHPELHRTWLEKISQDIKSRSSEAYHELMRIERFLESLDGEENGVLYENIWKTNKAADELAIDKTFMGFEEFLQVMEENGFDPALTMGKVEKISPGVELTRMQQIGVYNKSKNENGLRYLREGMGLSDADITKISDGLTDTQKKLADWYLEKWRAYRPLIIEVAESVGMDTKELLEEFNYSTLIRTDIDPSEEVEFTDVLTNQFAQESLKPEQGFLEKRKKRVVGKIELDEAVSYLTSMRRIERFLAMAPVAKKVGAILQNKEFKSALNDATYGYGVKLLNTWMQDSIRGYVSEDAGRWNKILSILRRNAAVYAIGWNIPSVFRQTLALFNAAAVNPLMLKYIPINTAKATKNFGKLEKEVLDKSALVRTRDIDRDVRRKWDQETISKRLEGKDPFDKKSLAWLKWMDHRTVIVGWKSLYDTAIEKSKTEKEAVEYADKWIGRTQEMGGAKDLPHFFRGGTMAKILTTFENQVNNQFNFYAHDIIGARRRGDISNTEVAYRVMFSHILPAILMGMIGRGGLPKTWKQLLTDVVTYPIASLMLIGRLINRTIEGFGNSTSIVEAGPEAVGQAARAAVKGDVRKFIAEAAKAIMAITGKGGAQIVRTIGGAYDLAAGNTKDPRRLIWSEWALEQGKKKSSTPPRRPPTRPPTRRPPTRRPG